MIYNAVAKNMKDNKIGYLWAGLLISGSAIAYFLINSIVAYVKEGYILNINSLTGEMVIAGFIVMSLFFLAFLVLIIKRKRVD